MSRLAGRVAVVTGAGRGIGRATALRLARDGAAVAVNDIDADSLSETAALIESAGGQALPLVADTVSMAAATRLLSETNERLGSVDIVVNVAGIARDAMFHHLDDPKLDEVLDVNVKTAFHTTQAAMPYLRDVAKVELSEHGAVRHHRKVVFTSSASALVGNPGQFNYVAAKGALIAGTRTLARELAPFGINVNSVAPGFIDTRMTQVKRDPDGPGIPAEVRDAIIGEIPIGRPGAVEEVASVIGFLASPDSDYVTGVTLPVAGGLPGTM